MSTWALATVRRVVSDLSMYEDGRAVPSDVLDAFIMSLELVYREMIAQDCMEGLNEAGSEACRLIGSALCILQGIVESEEISLRSGCDNQPLVYTGRPGRPGRPQFDISRLQLQYLVENRFTGPEIAALIGVSLSTVRR